MKQLKLTFNGSFDKVFGLAWHFLFNAEVLSFDRFEIPENGFESGNVGLIEDQLDILAIGLSMQGDNLVTGNVGCLILYFDIIGSGRVNFEYKNLAAQDFAGNDLPIEAANVSYEVEFINKLNCLIEEIEI